MSGSAEPATIWPVFIASRGRPLGATAYNLDHDRGPFRLVVEPHEAYLYEARWGRARVLIMGEDDRGLAYARNFILDRARREGLAWFWMLDDDIAGWSRVVKGRCKPCDPASALLGVQGLLEARQDVAQGALEYRQVAWSQAAETVVGGYCDVAVAIHAGRVGRLRFREAADLKVDRDFTLQVLAAGWNTLRACRWAFAAPTNGSNEGGLREAYAEPGREAASSRAMADLWGVDVCRPVVKRSGRPDVRIDWSRMRTPSSPVS